MADNLTMLAERVEAAAAGESREMLWQTHRAIYVNVAVVTAEYARFVKLLDAGAYLDAAMSLIPEGGFGSLTAGHFLGGRPGFVAVVTKPARVEANAATKALAACAAALRSHAARNEGEQVLRAIEGERR